MENRQTEYARQLRKNMTPEERTLWYAFLREHPLRFMRQRPIDRFIVDFYCAKAKLVIELDGSQHFEDEGSEKDRERDAVLAAYGIKVLRIPNNAVRQNFRGVCERINQELTELTSLPLEKGRWPKAGGIDSGACGGLNPIPQSPAATAPFSKGSHVCFNLFTARKEEKTSSFLLPKRLLCKSAKFWQRFYRKSDKVFSGKRL